jgi:hypothetical protein
MELNAIGEARLGLIGDAELLGREFIHVEKCLLILPDDGTRATLNDIFFSSNNKLNTTEEGIHSRLARESGWAHTKNKKREISADS